MQGKKEQTDRHWCGVCEVCVGGMCIGCIGVGVCAKACVASSCGWDAYIYIYI